MHALARVGGEAINELERSEMEASGAAEGMSPRSARTTGPSPFRTFLSSPMCELSADAIADPGGRGLLRRTGRQPGFPDRPGAILGPDACRRESLVDMGATTVEFRIDLQHYWKLVDCGDVSVAGGNLAATTRPSTTRRRRSCARRHPDDARGRPLDPIPGVKALATTPKPGRLPAHRRAPRHRRRDQRRTQHDGLAARRAIDKPNVDPSNCVLFGVRGAANTRRDRPATTSAST